jgi:hypothetical protein
LNESVVAGTFVLPRPVEVNARAASRAVAQ